VEDVGKANASRVPSGEIAGSSTDAPPAFNCSARWTWRLLESIENRQTSDVPSVRHPTT
jgi:hypothetical protein